MLPSSKIVTKGSKGNVSLLDWYLGTSKQFFVVCKTLSQYKQDVKARVPHHTQRAVNQKYKWTTNTHRQESTSSTGSFGLGESDVSVDSLLKSFMTQ